MKHVICTLLCLLDKTDYKKKIIDKNSKHPEAMDKDVEVEENFPLPFKDLLAALEIKLILYRLTGKIKSNFIHMGTSHT